MGEKVQRKKSQTFIEREVKAKLLFGYLGFLLILEKKERERERNEEKLS